MESSIKAAQPGGISQPKPTLAPKPRLTPKPFSLQKNTSIRSINAPKAFNETSKKTTQKTVEQAITPDPKPISVSVLNTKNQPKPTTESKKSQHEEDRVDSSVGKLDPASQTAPPKDSPKTEPIQEDSVIQTNHKTSSDVSPDSEQKISKNEEDGFQTPVIQKPEESGNNDSSAVDQKYRLSSVRKRLPAELTSKFETGGSCPPPLPKVSIPVAKNDTIKPEPLDQEHNQTTPEPSNKESDEDGLGEDYTGGGSIKRRISQLFDSSLRPEVTAKREEPEIINSTGGVKERIKNWVTETNSENEKKPQFVPRPRSRSFEPAAPSVDETPKVPPVEPPASVILSREAVDLPSKVLSAEKPKDTPTETSKDAIIESRSLIDSVEASKENEQQKSNTSEVVLRNRSRSLSQTATDEGDSSASESPQRPLKRDKVKRRSVHFGTVERDDGGPPVPLGSDPDTSEEEGEENAEPAPVSGQSFQKKYDEASKEEEEERLKHLEFERRRRAEEHEQARIQNEEEQKEREKEKAKQLEEERERRRQREVEEREKLRLLEEEERERLRKMEEEERERQRLREEEERERQRKEELERARLKEEERERERLREEEVEREMHRQREEREKGRQLELMLQRQREAEKERARQEDQERLKKELEERERERIKEEERLREERERERVKGEERERERIKEEERLKEERERQRQKEEEAERERQVELMLQRRREEERERAKWEEERLKQELQEREKVRLMEEKRLEEERERLREERERQRQIDEEMERLKAERERLRQKEEEMERLKAERERQRLREEEMERLKAERERERLREEEMERLRAERERERLREEEMERLRAERERERLREEEMERLREERERQRMREEEMQRLKAERERLRQKEEEMERLRAEIEREKLRLGEKSLIDENMGNQGEEMKVEKKTAEEWEREKELLWQRQREERLREEERERQRLREEEEERERARQEVLKEQQEKEAMERIREIEIEKRIEEEKRRQLEKERLEELERKMEEELERKRAHELREKLRQEEERERTSRAGPGLVSLDVNPLPPAKNSESTVEVVYDDFSVKQPQMDVDFDDFSVKPKRWGSLAKKDSSPVIRRRWEDEKQEVEELVPMEVNRWENKMPEQVERPDSSEPSLAPRSPRTPEESGLDGVQLISIKYVDEERRDDEAKMIEDTTDNSEDKQETQVSSYAAADEDKDTDALIEDEPIQQEEACDQPSETDSPQPAPDEKEEEKEEPEASPEVVDTTDFMKEEAPAPFPESSAPLLDTRLQRSKAVLSKRRTRSRPSRGFRAGMFTPESPDWRSRDSTDEKEVKQKDSDEEEEPKSKKVSNSSPSAQRVPMFPGLSPSALLAQLKRRTAGGGTGEGEETEEDKSRQEMEIQKEEKAAPSPSQLSRSPRTASNMAGAARVLPPLGGGDKGGVASPAWLKELKSKKRLSQHEGEA